MISTGSNSHTHTIILSGRRIWRRAVRRRWGRRIRWRRLWTRRRRRGLRSGQQFAQDWFFAGKIGVRIFGIVFRDAAHDWNSYFLILFCGSPFEKNFYIEHPDVTKRSEQEAEAWRASKGIVVRGTGIPKPAMSFEEASMPEYVLTEVLKCGFDKPTPIQSQAWPMALLGRDM